MQKACGTLSTDDTVFCYICGTKFNGDGEDPSDNSAAKSLADSQGTNKNTPKVDVSGGKIDFGYNPEDKSIRNTPTIPNAYSNSNNSYTTVTNEKTDSFKYGTVNTIKDPLNVRKQPSINSDKLGSIERGATLTIIGDKDEWYEIKFGDQICYVSKLYVILENEPKLSVVVTGVVMTKDDPLNVREQPNTSSKIIGTVSKGGTVSIISDDGEWYEIKYGSGKGYVSKKYVSLT